MTPDQLTALAADCEARAKAGEKPEHPGWLPSISRPFFNCQSCTRLLNVEVCESRDKRGGPTTWQVAQDHGWHDAKEFTSKEAGMLFAEALLAHATAPLHAARIAALEEVADRYFVAAVELCHLFEDMELWEVWPFEKVYSDARFASEVHEGTKGDLVDLRGERAKKFRDSDECKARWASFYEKYRADFGKAQQVAIEASAQYKESAAAKDADKLKIAALEARIAELELRNALIQSMEARIANQRKELAIKEDTIGSYLRAFKYIETAGPRLRPMAEAPRDGTAFLVLYKKAGWEVIRAGVTWTTKWAEIHCAGWLPLPAPEGTK